MRRLAALAVVASLVAPTLADAAAPSASFEALRAEGCVAPCAVLFDATATRDAATDQPFLDLRFAWDFGDARGEQWPLSGEPKDRATGGIAGHLFTRGGNFPVALRVENAAGQGAEAARTVVVRDADAAFPGTATTCVSASGRFDGCPEGAARVTSADFAAALANAPGRRTLLRRGERFTWRSPVKLTDAGPRGASLGVFGPGTERATLAAAGAVAIDPGSGWRIAHVALEGGPETAAVSAFNEHEGVDGFTVYDVSVRGFGVCAEFWSPSRPNRGVAFVEVSCGGFPDPGNGTKFYEDVEESMFLGLDLDKGDHRAAADQTEFAYRTVFSVRKLIQHGRFRGRAPNQSKNLLQLRHCPTVGPWLARCKDGAQPSRYVIVSDNLFVEGAGPRALTAIRVCDHGSCTGAPGGSQRIEDYLFERNLIQVAPGDAATDQLAAVFQLQGARIRVRDNVADLRGWPRAGPPRALFAMVDTVSNPGRDGPQDVRVERNTIVLGAGFPKPFVVCAARAGGGTLACRENLVAAPAGGPPVAISPGPPWQDAGSRVATESPFAAALPGPLAATRRDLAAYAVRGEAGARVGPRGDR